MTINIRRMVVALIFSIALGISPSTIADVQPLPTEVPQAVLQWATKHSLPKVSQEKLANIITIAFNESAKHHVSPLLTLAVIANESKFDTTAQYNGAKGLMQIIPRWHRDKIQPTQVHDPEQNIRAGVKILRVYLDKANGDISRALLYYNGSIQNPSSKYNTKVLKLKTELKRSIERETNQTKDI